MLKVSSVSVRYNIIPVLQDVSFSVEEGQFVAIVGANSAGKSTILRTVSGLIHPFEGSIEFRGEAIHGAQPYDIAAKGIAHIPRGARSSTSSRSGKTCWWGPIPATTTRKSRRAWRRCSRFSPNCGSDRTRRARP